MTATLKCDIFENIASSNKGSILNVNKIDVKIFLCKFNKITSRTFPGSFYATYCNFTIDKSIFVTCYAAGSNEYYGRISYVVNSIVNASQFSAVECGPSVSGLGDSLNAFHYSDVVIDEYNASKCYGVDGSSSVSILHQTKEARIKHLNNVDGIDWNSFEIYHGSHNSYIDNSNFINSTKNSVTCLHTSFNSYFRSCCFFLVHSKFCYNPNTVFLEECTTDSEKSGFTFKAIVPQTNFTMKIKEPTCKNQKVCTIKISRQRTRPLLLYLIIMLP